MVIPPGVKKMTVIISFHVYSDLTVKQKTMISELNDEIHLQTLIN